MIVYSKMQLLHTLPVLNFFFYLFTDITSKRLDQISRKKKQSIRLKNVFIFVTKNLSLSLKMP